MKGNPQKLLEYCVSGTNISSVNNFLTSAKSGDIDYTGDCGANQLAVLLGIDEERALCGYSYFENDSLFAENNPILKDAQNFVLVKRNSIG